MRPTTRSLCPNGPFLFCRDLENPETRSTCRHPALSKRVVTRLLDGVCDVDMVCRTMAILRHVVIAGYWDEWTSVTLSETRGSSHC